MKKLIGYVNIEDWLEICFEDSQDTKQRNNVGEIRFKNGSPAMASEEMRIGKILISKLDFSVKTLWKSLHHVSFIGMVPAYEPCALMSAKANL